MANFEEASGAMDEMRSSEGALQKANDTYLNSVQAHVQQLKNTFVEFSQSAISADVIKDVTDFAKSLLQIVNVILKVINAIGGLKTVLPLVITFFTIIKGESIAKSILSIFTSFKNFGGMVSAGFQSGISGAKAFAASLKGVETEAQATGAAMNTALGVIGLIITAIMTVISVSKGIKDSIVNSWREAADAGKEASENVSNVSEAYQKYVEVSESGTASTAEMVSAQNTLRASLNLTASEFDHLSGRALSYSDAIKNATLQQLDLDISTQRAGIDAEKKLAQEAANDFLGYFLTNMSNAERIDLGEFVGDILKISDVSYFSANIDTIRKKLADLGTATNFQGKKYELYLDYFNKMSEATASYASSVNNLNTSIINRSIVELGRSVPQTTEAFEDYRNALIEIIKNNPQFAVGVQDTDERLQLATIAADNFLSTASGFEEFYNVSENAASGASTLAKGIKEIQDVANGTSDAIERLDGILKGDDYDTGMEKRVEYMQKLLEEVDAEHWGGQHYQALADYFNIDTSQSIEAQLEQIAKMRRYFDDADQGLINFLYDIGQLGSEYAEFDPNTGFFSFDAAHVEELASALGLTKDAFADLVNLYRIYTPPSEWLQFPPDEVARWLEQDEIIKKIGDDLYIDKDRFAQYADSAGINVDEFIEKLRGLKGEYENLKTVDLEINTNSLAEAQVSLLEYTQKLRDLDYSADEIAQNIAASLSTLDQDLAIGLVMNLPPELAGIRDEIISYLPEDLQTKIYADTGEADSAIGTTQKKLEDLGVEILNVDGSTITITVKDNIDYVMGRLNTLSTYASANGVTIRTVNKPYGAQENASGTKHAKAGLSLLGDEYSASGRPKPELVVSNGRAYLAGVNGPVLGRLNSGDIVYTNKETRQILGNNLSGANGIPAFASGTASRWWSKATGSAASFSSTSAYSSYTGSSGSSSASSTGSGDNWFEQQYELHNHYRKLDQETDSAYLTWLVGAWKKAYAEGIIELKDAHKYEEEAYELMKKIASDRFAEEYKTHQHMVAMGQETDQDYYSWLEWRHQTAYTNNEITLEEYWKYEEEVYKKAKDLIDDYFTDINAKISMLENANKSNSEIILWDEAGMRYVEEQIDKLKKEGKDNNDSTVQSLQKTWWSYYNDRVKREENVTKEAKSAAKELIDYRIKMLKKELDTEKSNLNQRLKNLQDFYSKQKELLQDQADEDKYLDEQAEKRKKVSDLEIQLAQIEYDNSAWAQKKRLELSQQLLDAQKELNEFEKEHALQVAKEKLDAIQEMQEKELQDQVDAIEKTTQSEAELYQKALHDVQNGGQDLYEAMVEYNNWNGTGNPEDISEMWDGAYTSLKKYKELFGDYYKDIKLAYGNDISPAIVDTSKIDAGVNPVIPDTEPKGPPAAAGSTPAVVKEPVAQTKSQATKADPVQGQKVRLKSGAKLARDSYTTPSLTPASWVIGRDLYIQAAYPGRNAPYHVGTTANINDGATTWVGWVDKRQLEGYAAGTQNALKGIHEINERGDEALFKTSSGNTYRLFSGGEKVFSSSATDFLYNLSNNPAAVLASVLGTIGIGTGSEVKNNTVSQNISLGDIYIQGNATEKTVSEIRREKRAEIDYMLKELNRLSK